MEWRIFGYGTRLSKSHKRKYQMDYIISLLDSGLRYSVEMGSLFRYPASPFEEMLQEPCIAAFGGAVLPGDVLAGFPSPVYHNATSLEITFLVKNFLKDSKMAEVIAWEKAFQLYMEDYVKNPLHANLTITYSTPEMSKDFLYV